MATPASCLQCGSDEVEHGGPGAGFGAVCTACGAVVDHDDTVLLEHGGGPWTARHGATTFQDDGAVAAWHLLRDTPAGGGRPSHCFPDAAQAAATRAARSRRVKQVCSACHITGDSVAAVFALVERAVAESGACTAALVAGAAYLVVRQHGLPVTLPEVASAAGCHARDVARSCVRLGAMQPPAGPSAPPPAVPPMDTAALMRRALEHLFPGLPLPTSTAVVACASALLSLAAICDMVTGRNPRAVAAAVLHCACAAHGATLSARLPAPTAAWPATRLALARALHVGEDTVHARLRELHAALCWLALGCGVPCREGALSAAATSCDVPGHLGAEAAWLVASLLPSLSEEDIRTAVQGGQAQVLSTPQGGAPLQLPPAPSGDACQQAVVVSPPAGAVAGTRGRGSAAGLRPLGARRTRGPSRGAVAKAPPGRPAAASAVTARPRDASAVGGAPPDAGPVPGDGEGMPDAVIADDEWAQLLRTREEVEALQELQALDACLHPV